MSASTDVQSVIPSEKSEQWTKVITPSRGWWDLRLGQLWNYQDLILVFVHRNFSATYKQTILGPLWFFIQPVFTTIVFTLIFNRIGNISTGTIPPFLFYFSGLVAWGYFQECLTRTASTFSANASLFGKVYFPRLTVPISIVITGLLSFLIQLAFFLVLMLIFWWKGAAIEPNWRILTIPLMLLQMAAIGLGMGCIVSALTTKYRDLSMLVSFGVQLWMYGSGVVIPLSAVDAKYQWIFSLNPMVPIIEGFRLAFLGQGSVDRLQFMLGLGISGLILVTGLVVFSHVEKTFTDTV